MIIRGLRALLVTVLSAALLAWIGRGLLGVDQRGSFLPFVAGVPVIGDVLLIEDQIFAPLIIGTAWGVLLTVGGAAWNSTSKVITGPVAMSTLVEARTTGLTVNDVPQHELIVEVNPTDGDRYLSSCRQLESADRPMLVPGAPIPVHYSLTEPDQVTPADLADPAVRRAALQWQVERGLIEPRLVRPRLHGRAEPAAVVALRPTGRHQDGQTELELTTLVSPAHREPFEAVSRLFIYPDAVSQVQVGSPVTAYWIPGDEADVAIGIEREALDERAA